MRIRTQKSALGFYFLRREREKLITIDEQIKETPVASQPVIEIIPFTNGQKVYLFVKRFLDIIFSLFMGTLLLIPMIVIAVMIRIESPGPAIFKQKRMGKDAKPFTIYKFRTMRITAPDAMASRAFSDSNLYITPLGSFLRRTSIDELPQLFNILIGNMSFVGYRPVCLTEEHLNQLRTEYGVFRVRPGITGLAQVRGRDNIGHETKAVIDAEYVNTFSFKIDLYCVFKTVKTIITGEGVM